MTEITHHPVVSSNIATVGHDPAASEMHVTFKDGGRYIYGGVTVEQAEALRTAASVGKHFHAHIKGKFEHRKVEAP